LDRGDFCAFFGLLLIKIDDSPDPYACTGRNALNSMRWRSGRNAQVTAESIKFTCRFAYHHPVCTLAADLATEDRPALLLTIWLIFYSCGIWVGTWLDPAPYTLLLPSLGAALWFSFRQRWPNRLLALFFFLLGLSMAALSLGSSTDSAHLKSLADRTEAAFLGKIVQSTKYAPEQLQLDLDQLQVLRNGKPAPLKGKLRLTIEHAEQTYLPGTWIQFRTRIRKPYCFGIPGEFNRPLYLAGLGIFATGTLDNTRGIVVLPPEQRPLSIADRLLRMRAGLIVHLERLNPNRPGKLLRALLLGDKSGLDEELRLTLSRSGLAHLFSVSGMHLGLVAGFLYLGGAFLYRRSSRLLNWQPAGRVVPLLLLPLLWCYTVLSGAALPTQRALLMAICAALLLLLRRQSSAAALLRAVVFLLLLIQPMSLFSPAFQLSVAGLWGIVYLLSQWSRYLTELPAVLKKPLQIFLATVAATLCTFPLTLLYFHQVSTVGPLANLLAVPAVGLLVLPSGLLGLLFIQSGAVAAGDLLLDFSGWILERCLQLVDWLLEVPAFSGSAWYPDPLQLMAVLALIGMLLIPVTAGRQRRPLQALCLIFAILLAALPNQRTSGLQITSLSVGQGESTLVSINGTHHYLIDGGGFYDSPFDVGSRLLAPALGWLGVHSLERIILTHNHPDHSLGLSYILEQSPNTPLLTAIAADQLPTQLAGFRTRLTAPSPGWQLLDRGAGWSLQLFTPEQLASDLNDRSLVLYAGFGRDGVLLTGDLARAGVHQLLGQPPPGTTTLLKLPHHGSRYSDTDLLLQQLQPQLAFASAGRNNRFGLPHPVVLDQLAARGVPLYRTDRDGSVQFRTRGHGWQRKPFRDWLFR
jgi:competence protein ComEC